MRVKGLDAIQTKRRRLSRLLGERGQATVEFALILPALLLLILGMLDFGKAFNYWIDETHMANEAARWATVNVLPDPAFTGVNASCSSATIPLGCEIKKQADTGDLQNGTGSVAAPGVCFTFSFPNPTGPNGTPQAGDAVKVDASSTYNWLSFLSGSVLGLGATKQITGSATMRLEQNPTSAVYGAGTQC
jgi:Flp pilus assembly protein TadG